MIPLGKPDIPVGKPGIPADAWKDIRAILASGQLVEGARCREFAQALGREFGSPHVVLVNSGTSALYLALKALDIGPGDAVLVPAYSFPATANAVAWAGAAPIFTDIDPLTWNMDAETVQARLATLTAAQIKPIKAVMPVQAFGNPVAIAPLRALARSRGWKVIEDAACAIGSSLDGQACGTHGEIGCFSFHPRKILTTSEGGALVVRSAKVAARLELLKNHGMIKKAGKVLFPGIGLNLRFTEVAASLGLSQLRILPALLSERAALAERYLAGFRNLGMTAQAALPGGKPNRQSLVARLPVKGTAARDKVFAALAKDGIQVTIGTYFIPALPSYRKGTDRGTVGGGGSGKGKPASYPAAETLFRQAISLPLYPGLGKAGVDQVLEGLRRALG